MINKDRRMLEHRQDQNKIRIGLKDKRFLTRKVLDSAIHKENNNPIPKKIREVLVDQGSKILEETGMDNKGMVVGMNSVQTEVTVGVAMVEEVLEVIEVIEVVEVVEVEVVVTVDRMTLVKVSGTSESKHPVERRIDTTRQII